MEMYYNESNIDRVSIRNLLNYDHVSIKTLLKDSTSNTVPDVEVYTRKAEVNGGCNKEKRFLRRVWNSQEDALLKVIVEKYGARRWKRLAVFFQERNAGQLRARWAHSLSCKDIKRPFSEDEDKYILKMHQKYGNSWTTIAREMPNRSDNTVKNRFRALQNKQKRLQSFVSRIDSN